MYTHAHTHTRIGAELLAPACYLFPSDLLLHCAPWESYKLRSQTWRGAGRQRGEKSNPLMCYMCKFAGLLLQINAFPPFFIFFKIQMYLFSRRALQGRNLECGTRAQHNDGEIIISPSRPNTSKKGSFVNEIRFIFLDGAWVRLECFQSRRKVWRVKNSWCIFYFFVWRGRKKKIQTEDRRGAAGLPRRRSPCRKSLFERVMTDLHW